MKKLCFVILFCLITMVGFSQTEIIYVDKNYNDERIGDVGSQTNPYMTIQEGIDAAGDGDTVLVVADTYVTYVVHTPIKIDHKLVSLVKEGEGVCILERHTFIGGNNAVIKYIGIYEDINYTEPILDGFTITHTVELFGGLPLPGRGIECDNCSYLTIRNNSIIGNNTGGIVCRNNSSPTITNNIIRDNPALFGGDNQNGGGGILCTGSSCPTITNNVIRGNSVSGTQNYFFSNSGGGIKCVDNSDATIINNIITDNSVSYSKGGGISSVNSSPVIINNTIANNTAYDYNGGGIAYEGISSSSFFPTITNNIITGNAAALNGGGIYWDSCSLEITYNNVWNNTPNNVWTPNCTGYVWDVAPGNIKEDPLFVAPVSDDYHLQSDSPCIDVGDNDALEISYPHIGFDIEENWRFIDSNTGDYGTIDIGAYEFVPQQTNTPPVADAGPDQTVAADDNCQADVTLDGAGSSDVEDDQDPTTPLTYTWTWEDPVGQAQEASGVQPTVPLGMGIHEITLTVKDSNGATDIDTVDITIEDPPTILLEGPTPILVSIGRWKWKKANKLTVSATDNCSSDVKIFIDNVEIFNKKGRPVLGKGVYSIVSHDIYVFPRGRGWSICVTVTATGESGNSVTEIICKTLLKYKGWSWKSFFRLLWRCFH
ncbi:MAG: right-handed parallel beta-helix repeat-containing protein [Candidatus Aminicenantes bacterium]|nr:right-handed parallel beta-helix repeat-containing protein [Candidatus Aminicenantes bacterium]